MLITSHPILPSLIARCFGWKTYKWNHEVEEIEWVDTGRELISLPHFSYGFVPDGWTSIAGYNQLFAIINTVRELSLASQRVVQWRWAGAASGRTKVSPWLDLRQFRKTVPKWPGNLGRKIRRAQKAGFLVESGGVRLLPEFCFAYERRIHQLGSAALPLFFFKELLMIYPDQSLKADAKVYVVYNSTRKVCGGAITLFYGDFCENTWFATLPEYQHLYSSYILHAHMIQDAIERGCSIYSFGRSTRGSGTHQFKTQWGTNDVELHWLQYPEPKGIDLKNYPFLLNIWKKVPLPLARRFNPFLSKRFY